MTIRVFIDGAVGTTGLEIRERLDGRDGIEQIILSDKDRKDAAKREDALNSADFVILCLPDDAAREAVEMIRAAKVRVIDASSAHRVADGWSYGFPELEPGQAAQIAEAARVSNPGCYPTGFLALVRPLIRAGLVPHDHPLTVNAVSGYSGGGKSMIAEFEDADAPNHTGTAFRNYGLNLAHKHVPEMTKHARIVHPPIFQPAVARTYRGMLVEVPLPLQAFTRRPSLDAIENALREAYRIRRSCACCPATRRRCASRRMREPTGFRCGSSAIPRPARRGWWRRSTISARAQPAQRCRTSTSWRGSTRPRGWCFRGLFGCGL